MLNLKISKRQASPAGFRLSRQSARFEDLLRRTDKDALSAFYQSCPCCCVLLPTTLTMMTIAAHLEVILSNKFMLSD